MYAMDRKSRTSRSATQDNSSEEFQLWKQICNSLMELEHIQKKAESVVKSLNDMRSTIRSDEGMSTTLLQRLKTQYRGGIELSSDETRGYEKRARYRFYMENSRLCMIRRQGVGRGDGGMDDSTHLIRFGFASRTITDVIEKLTVLTALREASELRAEKRKKKRKSEVDELRSSSSKKLKSVNRIHSPGTSVAARQLKQKDKNEEWILAVVINFYADKNKYQVEDVEQDEYGQKQKYMLPPRNVIPVPAPTDIHSIPGISPNQDVLALYPGTTCFYRAIVVHSPPISKDNGPIHYSVRFEDDNDEIKTVLKQHVLQIPKGKT
ncbi:hypothetical protein [Absidia glauca]|uniref:SGF29 C-terminal domain-containing protein n=1 Tax=Absidia glauca TaxID=4829 RepID=A0A163M5P1_ABSGL|nr:hypothetical protein [Absidia glauca]